MLVLFSTTEDGSVAIVRLWVGASEEEELEAFEEPVGLSRNWFIAQLVLSMSKPTILLIGTL